MDSTFYMNEHVVEHAVVSQLSSYLSCDTVGFKNRINFDCDILTDTVINKGEQWCRYSIFQWNIKGSFDIFNHISYHVTLVQLIELLVMSINMLVSQDLGFMVAIIKDPFL